MYNTTVVTGKIIEIRDDHVVTVEGDTVSTYHMDYYMMVDEEPYSLVEHEMMTETRFGGLFSREWKPLFSKLSMWIKKPNRA